MSTAQQIESNLTGELQLARQVQTSLLPRHDCRLGTWNFAYTYQAAGALSGDYVNLISDGLEDFYFALGDVSGKGIAASMLMSHLHATPRALVSAGMGIEEILKTGSIRLQCVPPTLSRHLDRVPHGHAVKQRRNANVSALRYFGTGVAKQVGPEKAIAIATAAQNGFAVFCTG